MTGDPQAELDFMKGSFADYYAEKGIEPPHRFARREWGFFPFGGKMMFRHIAFRTKEDMEEHFRRSVPMHAYHSAAYYQDPNMQPMAKKVEGWMGADLIFDLDADHIPGAEAMPYEQQLARVKEEVGRLVSDFLLDDLGFPRSATHLYFSGGRGYHVHVRDQSVLGLDAKDRRAIVDYITGRNLDYDVLFPPEVYSVSRYRNYVTSKQRRKFRNRGWGGWVKKIYEGKDRLVKDLQDIGTDAERVQRLVSLARDNGLDIPPASCQRIVDAMFNEANGMSSRRMLAEDLFQVIGRNELEDDFCNLARTYSAVSLSGETDEPVTTDTKRLIRAPTSLHGKTGFRVTSVPLEKLSDFDPMRDAVALPDDRIEVIVEKDTELSIANDDIRVHAGAGTVPRYAAYFLIARRKARLGPHMRTGTE